MTSEYDSQEEGWEQGDPGGKPGWGSTVERAPGPDSVLVQAVYETNLYLLPAF